VGKTGGGGDTAKGGALEENVIVRVRVRVGLRGRVRVRV